MHEKSPLPIDLLLHHCYKPKPVNYHSALDSFHRNGREFASFFKQKLSSQNFLITCRSISASKLAALNFTKGVNWSYYSKSGALINHIVCYTTAFPHLLPLREYRNHYDKKL